MRMFRECSSIAAAACCLFFSSLTVSQAQTPAPAQPAPYVVRDHYVKTEYHVKMRDGVTLFTSVYAPKETKDSNKNYPILITRTCYSVAPYGAEAYRKTVGPSRSFEESGYIFVYQDVRGRYESEGQWEEMTPHVDKPTGTQHDESTDMYDTTEWMLKNLPHNNGRVGILGISYPGFYTSASIIDGHPAIKAASPQAPVTDLHDNDDAYHNGAFMLEANDFYGVFRPQKNPVLPSEPVALPWRSADAYTAYLEQAEPLSKAKTLIDNPYFSDQMDHPNAGPYWDARDISKHMHNIHAAVLTVGGWFDAEDLSGPYKTFGAIAAQSPGVENRLVIGPWFHGAWAGVDGARFGDARFGSGPEAKTGEYFREKIQFPFFEHYLKDAPLPALATATVFETGSNVWKSYTAWPPAGSKPKMMYFERGGKLSFDPPAAGTGKGAAYDEYVSDPAHPVPDLGYATAPGPPREYMIADQRFAATRPDVLVYQSEPLTESITFAGPLRAKLHVSTSGTDSDFDVKLIDVYPAATPDEPRVEQRAKDVLNSPVLLGSYQQLVRGEPMRGKFRKSFRDPVAFVPNKVEGVDFSLVEVNHTFLKGHRIMVQVQSTWFPLVDLNPQTFVDISKAKPEDFKVATERVFHTASEPSGIEFQSLP